MVEIWKPIPEWPNYAVSTKGRIQRLVDGRGTRAGNVLSAFLVCGYPSVNLVAAGRRQSVRVHRLVAQVFLPRPAGASEVNHIDASRSNNDISNLEWVTPSGNRLHGYAKGACQAKGERNGYSRMTEDAVREVRRRSPLTPMEKRALARRFAVSPATIADVAAHRTWTHI